MFDFFQPIIDFFTFIVDMVKTLIDMVGMAVGFFTTGISMLPPQVIAIAGVLVTICLIYKILGRENQS